MICCYMMRIRIDVLLISVGFVSAAGVWGPLSPHFNDWLNSNGYSSYDFVRSDYGTQGSYGGKTSTYPNVSRIPVVFVHGNSDSALQTDSFSTGWDNSITYFEQNGYTPSELYATSWGDNIPTHAKSRTHSCSDVLRLRRFLLAVLAYTQSPKISIISHSMGVTLMRKAVKGGTINGPDGSCDVGTSLMSQIHVFLGIAGGNYGLCSCVYLAADSEKGCNKENGFWPGDYCGLNGYIFCGALEFAFPCTKVKYSDYLEDLNGDVGKEATYVYSMWSTLDDMILNADQVYGRPTSLIPNSTDYKVYSIYTHMQTKEKTAPEQYNMVYKQMV